MKNKANIENIPDFKLLEEALKENNIPEEMMRTRWLPMTDGTGLVLAIAWKNDEARAWQLFEASPFEAGHC